jgi:hypothetical protein
MGARLCVHTTSIACTQPPNEERKGVYLRERLRRERAVTGVRDARRAPLHRRTITRQRACCPVRRTHPDRHLQPPPPNPISPPRRSSPLRVPQSSRSTTTRPSCARRSRALCAVPEATRATRAWVHQRAQERACLGCGVEQVRQLIANRASSLGRHRESLELFALKHAPRVVWDKELSSGKAIVHS